MDIGLALSVVALLLSAFCVWQLFSLNRLKKIFFAGSEGLDLETVLIKLVREMRSNQSQQATLEEALLMLQDQLSFAVQKVGLVRYNPFGDGGGNFSFALALLDQHNSGVVVTSIHGRQQNRIYTKKIEHGRSDNQLTEEEEQAVVAANSNQIPLKKKTSIKQEN